jgi:hypothetical protein
MLERERETYGTGDEADEEQETADDGDNDPHGGWAAAPAAVAIVDEAAEVGCMFVDGCGRDRKCTSEDGEGGG